MASLRARNLHLPAIRVHTTRQRMNSSHASVNFPSDLSPGKLARPMIKLDELPQNQQHTFIKEIPKRKPLASPKETTEPLASPKETAKLRAIAEAVIDRAEMHDIIGKQRNNWNHHFLHSINSFALTASLMTGISSTLPPHLFAFKVSSMLLLSTVTCMMLVVNKIQPSQLAEEQRNATRLCKQLEREIDQMLARKSQVREQDISAVMEKVLALDKAYPLGLLPNMLEKFPEHVEPTCWWPTKESKNTMQLIDRNGNDGNGWSKELEEEMMGIVKVIRMKDESNYIELGKLVLGINKGLAMSGPIIAGLAAVATGLVDFPIGGSWAPLVSILGGALVAIVNTFEHGAQLGMIFEIFRNCAGLFQNMQQDIENNLSEPEVEKRENGEVFALKIALELGVQVSDLKKFANLASPSCKDVDIKEFASKLI